MQVIPCILRENGEMELMPSHQHLRCEVLEKQWASVSAVKQDTQPNINLKCHTEVLRYLYGECDDRYQST